MAVPKHRSSKARRDKRRTYYKLSVPGMSVCPKCGETKLPHRVCKSCGTYKDTEVLAED